MVSRRQLEANRANAKYSTGPKSERGKARSKRNALTHGLTAKSVAIAGENPEEFEALWMALEAAHRPADVLERELLWDLANSFWRLRRARAFEVSLIHARRLEIVEAQKRKVSRHTQRRESTIKLAHILIRLPGFTMPNKDGVAILDQEWLEALPLEDLEILGDFFEGLDLGSKTNPFETSAEVEQPHWACLSKARDSYGQKEEQGVPYTGQALIRDGENHDTLGKLVRYENNHRNAIARTLNQLYILKAARAEQRNSIPISAPRTKSKCK